MKHHRPGLVMKARLAGALLVCLVSAACASRISSDATRQKWCGPGGGAGYGALTPMVVGGAAARASGFLLGVMVAPVGAAVGAVDGAVNNPCPDEEAEPAKTEQKPAPEIPGETARQDREPSS
jgi:hypothetical protein